MTTRTSVRPATQAALADALEHKTELVGVAVQDGMQPRDTKLETISIGDVRSVNTGLDHMVTGRKMRSDQFVFDVEFWAHQQGQKTPAIAKMRAAVMLAALENILADNATFNGLQWAQINGYDGPDAYPLDTGGYGAHVLAHVECLSKQI